MVTNTDLVGNRDSWIANASTISHGALGAAGGDFTVLAGGALSVLGSTGTAGGQKVGQRSDVQGQIPVAGGWKPQPPRGPYGSGAHAPHIAPSESRTW